MIVSIWTPVHAGIAGGVRGEEDIDPLRTPWVYFDDGIPGIGCRASAQEIIDAYIAVKESADDICAVAYVDNDGWPTNPDAGSQWKNERCDPPESSILDGYNLTVWSAKPVVRQSARYYFTQTITRDYCPVNMFNIDVDHVFSRVLYRYCPVGYNLRVELVDGVPDWSRYFCTRGIDAPERDQEGSCLAVGMMDGDNPVYLGSGNKRQLEADYVDARDPRFTLARHYNSMRSIYLGVPEAIGLFGVNWSSTYERSVRFVAQPSSTTVQLYRDDGDVYYFQYQNGV
jgi:hypothetical protein